jgi:hypothetical protein
MDSTVRVARIEQRAVAIPLLSLKYSGQTPMMRLIVAGTALHRLQLGCVGI